MSLAIGRNGNYHPAGGPSWGSQLLKATILAASSIGLGWLTSRFWVGISTQSNAPLNSKALTIYGQNNTPDPALYVERSINHRSILKTYVEKPTLFEKMAIAYHYVDNQLTFPGAAAEAPPTANEAPAYLTTFGQNAIATTIYPTKTGESFLLESLRTSRDASSILISKLDQKGKLIWRKVINSDKWVSCTGGFVTTDDGGFVCGGSIGNLALVIKFDSEGDVVWSRQFGKAATKDRQSINHIAMDVDILGRNNFYAIGRFADTLVHGLIIISNRGESLSEFDAFPSSAIEPENPLVKKLNTMEYIAVLPYNGDGRTYFARPSPHPRGDWFKMVEKTFRTPNPLVLTVTREKNFIVAGTGYDDWARFVISKIKSLEGSLLWAKSIRCGGSLHEVCALYEENDGSIILIGKLSLESMTIVTKLDSEGAVQWSRKINGEGCEGGSLSPDGGIFAVGENVNGPSSSNYTSFVVKLDANGTIPNNCSYIESFNPVTQSISLPLSDASLRIVATLLDTYEDAQLDFKNLSVPPQITPCSFPPDSPPQSNHLLEIIAGSVGGAALASLGVGAGVYFWKKRHQAGYEQLS